ncbi:hypothetical protein ABW19_dt0202099 [Dactylella cylindrospora]|nr:hypothetical protein ABW19_dt0202099 [Dactylella cylindrospora]
MTEWCPSPARNCAEYLQFRPNLIVPFVDYDDKVQKGWEPEVQVGCSGNLWYFHPNFIILDGDMNPRKEIIKDTPGRERKFPYYEDPDLEPVPVPK